MSRKSNLTNHLSPDDFGQISDNFMSPFGDQQSIFNQMSQMHQNFFKNDPFQNAFQELDTFFQKPHEPSSSQYYCSSTSTTILPNGVVETKKHTRSNDMEQKEHFQQIGEKRVIGRYEKDLKTGKENIRRDLFNMEEDEIGTFHEQFNSKQGALGSQNNRRLK
ncbi:Disc-associated protein [Spironucleus salmonicida]|uniref:Disc-associated protein n=1 Tax=Spironucleus salmonicida TaxID=348837 RepID=V6M274_9EUKA|nr:Disc-associated protein [Spironucleus salmonicida]|eukprot:EST47319.1 hypothetical protein SS50377_12584 [Spironucleus salmonicida]